jgi:two-component system LytT family response regulator
MNTYSAIVIDDEKKLRDVLRLKLEKTCPEIKIIGEAENAQTAFELIKKVQPQVVFLDIAMPRGSGFDLLSRFEKVNFEVIFVTGYSDYALEALRISAVDYLLKPVINEDLKRAVEKACERINHKLLVKGYELLQHNVSHQGEQVSRVSIPGVNSYEVTEIRDIIRCEGEQKYTRIFLKDGRNLLSSYNIGVFKEMFECYEFYSSHKSHLINIHHIVRYKTEGLVVMTDNSEVPVSRRKKEEFKEHVLLLIDQNQGLSD